MKIESLWYPLSPHFYRGLLHNEVTIHYLKQNKMSQLKLYFQPCSNILKCHLICRFIFYMVFTIKVFATESSIIVEFRYLKTLIFDTKTSIVIV